MKNQPGAKTPYPKVVLFGIDSATWHVIKPLVKKGQLPHFAHLIENGAHGPLTTFSPTLSPLLWATISTGKSPDKHGIKSFTALKIPGMKKPIHEYRWEQLSSFKRLLHRAGRVSRLKKFLLRKKWIRSIPLTSDFRKCKAIWNIASNCNRTVGFVGWWNTWPAERVEGFIISQYVEYLLNSPNEKLEKATYPPELFQEALPFIRKDQKMTLKEVQQFFNLPQKKAQELARFRYTLTEPAPELHHPDKFLKLTYLRHEFRFRAGLHFYKKFFPDLFGIYFSADAAQHFFWHCMEPGHFSNVKKSDIERYGEVIKNWYIYLDIILGQFLDEADEYTSFIIVSDHGHGPSHELPWSGQHYDKPDGIVILYGQAIKPGTSLKGASIYDITPTVLAMMGLPAALDMDGRVLSEALAPEFLARYPVRAISTFEREPISQKTVLLESDVDEIVMKNLRDLGYID